MLDMPTTRQRESSCSIRADGFTQLGLFILMPGMKCRTDRHNVQCVAIQAVASYVCTDAVYPSMQLVAT